MTAEEHKKRLQDLVAAREKDVLGTEYRDKLNEAIEIEQRYMDGTEQSWIDERLEELTRIILEAETMNPVEFYTLVSKQDIDMRSMLYKWRRATMPQMTLERFTEVCDITVVYSEDRVVYVFEIYGRKIIMGADILVGDFPAFLKGQYVINFTEDMEIPEKPERRGDMAEYLLEVDGLRKKIRLRARYQKDIGEAGQTAIEIQNILSKVEPAESFSKMSAVFPYRYEDGVVYVAVPVIRDLMRVHGVKKVEDLREALRPWFLETVKRKTAMGSTALWKLKKSFMENVLVET